MSYHDFVIPQAASPQPTNSVGAFGDKFRQAREKKNISLDDVSNVTKISARMLQAIEEEHFDLLPGGVFNKGFIRAYAKHLGLNDQEAVSDYLACLRQAQIDAQEVWQPAPPAPAATVTERRPAAAYQKPRIKAHAAPPPVQAPVQPPDQTPARGDEELPHLQLPLAEHVRARRPTYAKKSPDIPWNLVAVIVVIIAFSVFLWIRHVRRAHTESASLAASQPSPVQTTPPHPAPIPSTPGTSPTTPSPAKSAAGSSSHASPAQPSPARPPQSTPSTTPAPVKPPPNTPSTPPAAAQANQANKKEASNKANEAEKNQNDAQNETADNSSDDVTVRIFPAARPPAAAPVRMTLVVRANETSWISITADGQPVVHETLIAPAETSFHASHQIVARIGNAAGVSFNWNGQEFSAQGAEAEVKTFVFDSTGMREAPNQPPVPNH
jgi:cytoskeletal protein RodZ